MRIEQQWTDGVLALSLRGKLNTDEQREMLRATIEQLVGQGHRQMVLDLTGLRRVNSEVTVQGVRRFGRSDATG